MNDKEKLILEEESEHARFLYQLRSPNSIVCHQGSSDTDLKDYSPSILGKTWVVEEVQGGFTPEELEECTSEEMAFYVCFDSSELIGEAKERDVKVVFEDYKEKKVKDE